MWLFLDSTTNTKHRDMLKAMLDARKIPYRVTPVQTNDVTHWHVAVDCPSQDDGEWLFACGYAVALMHIEYQTSYRDNDYSQEGK